MAPEDYVFSAKWAGTNGEAPKPGRGLFLEGRLSWRPSESPQPQQGISGRPNSYLAI
jgi:hypothetical protein